MGKRRKMRFIAIGLAISILSFLAAGASLQAASDILLVKGIGQVEVKTQRAASWTAVSNGTILQYGDLVRTGARSTAEIRFRSGTIRMYENTVLEIPVQPDHRPVRLGQEHLKRIFLQKGRSLFQIMKNRLEGEFEVMTPNLIAGVKGTTFRVAEEEKVKGVTVLEGVVVVRNRLHPGEVVELGANRYTVLKDGHLTPEKDLLDSGSSEPGITRDPITRDPMMTQASMEDRLTDLLEANQDLQTEVISRSILLDTSGLSPTETQHQIPEGSLISDVSIDGAAMITDTDGAISGLADTGIIGLP